MNIFEHLADFFTGHVFPFLKNLGKAVVKAEIDNLKPLATKLVADAEGAFATAAASGSISQLGHVLGELVKSAAVEAEKSAVSAGATSLFAALGTALATNPVTAVNLAPAQPTDVH